MERLIAVALLQQSLELFRLRAALTNSGVWSWEILQNDFRHLPGPLRGFLRLTLSMPNFLFVVALQFTIAVLMLAFSEPILILAALWTASLISVRFRGAFNGGSDAMTWMVLLGLTIARLWPAAAVPAIGYVAIQVGLSYTLAGIAKIRNPRWRDGTLIRDLLLLPGFDVPTSIRVRVQTAAPAALRGAAVGLLAFECLFPLAYFDPRVCLAFLGIGLIFHLGNAWILGLNRFVPAWLAAYPAVWWLAQFISSRF